MNEGKKLKKLIRKMSLYDDVVAVIKNNNIKITNDMYYVIENIILNYVFEFDTIELRNRIIYDILNHKLVKKEIRKNKLNKILNKN